MARPNYNKKINPIRNLEKIKRKRRIKFYPEFLNIIDEIVIFNHLTIENIHSIIDIELDKLLDRVSELGYTVKISKKAKDFLCEKGYDRKYGARPLKRTIQKHIEDLIASEILDSKINPGDTISLDYFKGDENLKIKIKSNKTPKTSGK